MDIIGGNIAMRWLALQFETTHEASDLIADLLSELGAAGVQVEDAAEIRAILADPASLSYADDDFMDNLDETVRIQGYFADYPEGVRCRPAAGLPGGELAASGLYADSEWTHIPLTQLEMLLRQKLGEYSEFLAVGAGYAGWQEVREEDWADSWKQYYRTLHLTDRLVVNPSWIDYEPAAGEIVIRLDPGSAFGTGTHETTALCAELLDEILLPGDRLLDLGTGSGILAIIAAQLGAAPVEAIDIDPLAVSVAAANCAANQVAADCHAGELRDARESTYDIIVANIIADVIRSILPAIPTHLAGDGLFIASGIIADKLDPVLEAAREAGLELLVCRSKGDWRAVVFRRG
jgi:ribosomal protein L11 methyltransferase